ncbi:MAG: cysteine hydrolase [Lachnospiraceae bacterium]|nr:cysteine hydrolase [Lachnospiraceae bacterium]
MASEMNTVIKKIDPRKTAVIVVDMTNDFVCKETGHKSAGTAILPQMAAFLDKCREKGMKIIYTTHVYRDTDEDIPYYMDAKIRRIDGKRPYTDDTYGIQVHDMIAPKGNELVIKKHHFSGFEGTDLDIVLRKNKIENTVIVGVCSDVCCMETGRAAMYLGYGVIFIAELNRTLPRDTKWGKVSEEEMNRIALVLLEATTGDVMSEEEFWKLDMEA